MLHGDHVVQYNKHRQSYLSFIYFYFLNERLKEKCYQCRVNFL